MNFYLNETSKQSFTVWKEATDKNVSIDIKKGLKIKIDKFLKRFNLLEKFIKRKSNIFLSFKTFILFFISLIKIKDSKKNF